MNVLPWLLDWPPSRGTVAVFLLVTTASVGTLVVFGGVTDEIAAENVTVDASDVTVRLNDEMSVPDGNGSVQTCLGSGTPGDSVSVIGDVHVEVPANGDRAYERDELAVTVRLERVGEVATSTIEGTGRETIDVFAVQDDEGTLAVDETATLRIRASSGDSTVVDANRSVDVENDSRSYSC